jgi:hypothetical protein
MCVHPVAVTAGLVLVEHRITDRAGGRFQSHLDEEFALLVTRREKRVRHVQIGVGFGLHNRILLMAGQTIGALRGRLLLYFYMSTFLVLPCVLSHFFVDDLQTQERHSLKWDVFKRMVLE